MPKRSLDSRIPLVAINDSELLVQTKGKAFQKYDVVEDEWSKYPISVPQQLKGKRWNIKAYNSTTKSLYVVELEQRSNYGVNLTEFDVQTGSIRSKFADLPLKIDKILLIGDNIHIFGRYRHNGWLDYHHLIINKHAGTNQKYDSAAIVTKGRSQCYPVVHSKARNSILCLVDNGRNHVIAEYSLRKKQWAMRQCNGSHGYHEGVCSANGRYLIISGSHNSHSLRDSWRSCRVSRFLVYDLNEKTLKQRVSAVRYPDDKGGYRLFSMRDKWMEGMAAFGFVRECFDEEKLKGVCHLPRYIIQMIAKWIEMEYIHLMRANVCPIGHWKMGMNEMLESGKSHKRRNR